MNRWTVETLTDLTRCSVSVLMKGWSPGACNGPEHSLANANISTVRVCDGKIIILMCFISTYNLYHEYFNVCYGCIVSYVAYMAAGHKCVCGIHSIMRLCNGLWLHANLRDYKLKWGKLVYFFTFIANLCCFPVFPWFEEASCCHGQTKLAASKRQVGSK